MRKLMWLTLGFTAAAGFGIYLLPPVGYFYGAGVCALLLAVCLIFLLRLPGARIGAMLLCGCVVAFLYLTVWDALTLSTVRAVDEQEYVLTITATDYSEPNQYGGVVQGKVTLNGKRYRIRLYHDAETMLSPGDQLTGRFVLRSTLPEGGHSGGLTRSRGTFLTASVRGKMVVTNADKLPWYGYPAAVRDGIKSTIRELFPEDTAAFAKALLLGETEDLDYATDTAFKESGIRHIIAVSGLHVTILFSLLHMISFRRRWLSAMIALPLLLFFAAVVGFTASISRACLMLALRITASLLDQEYDSPTALAFAVLVMLLWNPWTVTNVGFQLSVSCMVGILLFAPRIQNYLMDKKRLGRFHGLGAKVCTWFSVSVAISISANIFTAPLCALYFHMVSLVGILTNLLTLWMISYIFYGILLVCTLGMIAPLLGTGIAWAISWAIRYVIAVATGIAKFPFAAVYTQSIYIVFWLVAVYLLLAVYLLMKQKRPLLFGLCAGMMLTMALMISWVEPQRDECRVTVLDVGQGQCILLQSEGKNFLVDCGGDSDTAAADRAAGLLLSQGIDRLDGLILTHYDADHAAGAVYLLQRISADTLFLPNCEDAEGIRPRLQNAGGSSALLISQQVVVTFGDARITLIPSERGETDNESGLCVLFQTKNCDILITGDRSERGELELLRQLQLPQLELLIVGHHGSKYSTSRELLIKTRPQTAIISVGSDNRYGHPAREVLARLAAIDCVIYRTDLDGTVVYRR